MIRACQRTQSGTVLPVCLLFLFLIAQLAMSAMETASLNHAMIANMRQASDVSRAAQSALDHALEQLASPDVELPLLVSEQLPDAAGARPLRFAYRVELVDAGSREGPPEVTAQGLAQQPGSNARAGSDARDNYCVLHHRIEFEVYDTSDNPLQRNHMGHYLCCDETPGCPAPSLSLWVALEQSAEELTDTVHRSLH